MTQITLQTDWLAKMLPMHLHLSAAGGILHAGPTLCKTLNQNPLGRNFWDLFEVKTPGAILTMADLERHLGQRLHLTLRAPPHSHLRGAAIPLCHNDFLLNLSFGARLPEAVCAHDLVIGDFAATDIAMELLCLIEVNGLVRSQLKTLNQRLQSEKTQAEIEARTDPLTGLYNRRALDTWLQERVASLRPFGVMRLDLDHFKVVNDRYGHHLGDRALIHLADVLRQSTRKDDMIARVGGDEFVVLFPDLTSTRKLHMIAGRILKALRLPFGPLPRDIALSVSIGITVSTHYAPPEAEVLLADADRALYRAKKLGRGRAILHHA